MDNELFVLCFNLGAKLDGHFELTIEYDIKIKNNLLDYKTSISQDVTLMNKK